VASTENIGKAAKKLQNVTTNVTTPASVQFTPIEEVLSIGSRLKPRPTTFHTHDWDWLVPLPQKIAVKSKGKDFDFIHWFVKENKIFEKEYKAKKMMLRKDGMLWVSWPKKASKVETDLNENVIRDFALKNGLVDVKVCSVNEIWSGLKLVYRLTDR